MIRRLLSLFLAFVTILSLLPTAAFAASSEEDALGEVDIYNGDYELGYLAINGTVRKQKYTYFLYESNDGSTKESPAYCVNPNQYGVPQTVGPGESIKYLAEEKASDPKVVGIISNGYPHRSLGELGLENKYQAFYATKMALWYYLIPSWDISNLKVAPGLSGSELDIGNRILAAAKDIYKRGTTYNYIPTPEKSTQTTCPASTSCAGDSPARHFQMLAEERDLKMPEALSSLRLPAWLKPDDLRIFCLRTFQDCLRMTRAGRFLPSSPRLMTWGTAWNGWCLTARISVSPRSESGCSLSDILIPDAPEKYFLSSEQTEKLLYKSSAGRRDRESMTPEGPPVHRLPEVEEKE